jgi:SAM-dependent methyltransferase
MSYLQIVRPPARAAYATLAPHYDRFTDGYDHEQWLKEIEARAIAAGLRGRRALDIACGTGKSFAPLLARGYAVTACDISPEMVDVAREKFGDEVEDLFVADMCELPRIGVFDLVTCLNDAVNYLLAEDELEAAFRGVAGLLAPGGVYAFDVNSLSTFRTAFAQTFVREDEGGLFCWRGEAPATLGAGDAAAATLEAFVETDDGLWERASSRHVQRHHPAAAIHAALAAAGLECAAVAGQRAGGHLDDHVDETEHIKVVYFAHLAGTPEGGESTMRIIGI